jgi:chromosome segregation ATPase
MMRIFERWFSKTEPSDESDASERRMGHSTKHEEAHLRAELRQLMQQREGIERRGCLSDSELEAKDQELDELDRRIKTIKNQQFRLRTQGKMRV